MAEALGAPFSLPPEIVLVVQAHQRAGDECEDVKTEQLAGFAFASVCPSFRAAALSNGAYAVDCQLSGSATRDPAVDGFLELLRNNPVMAAGIRKLSIYTHPGLDEENLEDARIMADRAKVVELLNQTSRLERLDIYLTLVTGGGAGGESMREEDDDAALLVEKLASMKGLKEFCFERSLNNFGRNGILTR